MRNKIKIEIFNLRKIWKIKIRMKKSFKMLLYMHKQASHRIFLSFSPFESMNVLMWDITF